MIVASLQIFAMKICLWIRQSNPVSRGHFFKEKESITLLLSYRNPLAQNYPTCFENRFLMGYYKIFTQREISLKSLFLILKRVASTPWQFPPNKENQSYCNFVYKVHETKIQPAQAPKKMLLLSHKYVRKCKKRRSLILKAWAATNL